MRMYILTRWDWSFGLTRMQPGCLDDEAIKISSVHDTKSKPVVNITKLEGNKHKIINFVTVTRKVGIMQTVQRILL